MDRRMSLRALAAGALTTAAARAMAEADSRSQITIYVGATGSVDLAARLIADQIRESLGRPAVVFPRLGAGQRLAIGETRRAAPDGRTLMFMTHGPFALYPNIYTKLDYDPDADFTPIIGVSKFAMGVAVGPGTPVRTFQELVDWIKAHGSESVFGAAPGTGALPHFVGAAIGLETGLKLVQVPYKDSAPAVQDLMAGRLPLLITGLSALVPMHKEGRLRLLALTGDSRLAATPEVPTLLECGLKVNSSNYAAVFGPARMPAVLVQQLADAIAPIRTKPAIVDMLSQQTMSMWDANGAEVTRVFQAERRRLGEVVRAVGYQPEPM